MAMGVGGVGKGMAAVTVRVDHEPPDSFMAVQHWTRVTNAWPLTQHACHIAKAKVLIAAIGCDMSAFPSSFTITLNVVENISFELLCVRGLAFSDL